MEKGMKKSNKKNILRVKGAYFTGKYRNLFTELLGKTESEVKDKIKKTWEQLFYGNKDTERLYYTIEPDMAYIKDTYHNDVRSEGISYGMMITVQLDKKEEFDRLWKWTKTYMQHKEETRKDYFAWHLKTDGTIISPNSASDGEEWIVMALFFAAGRWNNGKGIYNYQNEAQKILESMLNKAETSQDDTTISNIFNRKEKQIVFVPLGTSDDFTDPSYHTPHFYELWGRWANKNNKFWCDVAKVSRKFFKKTAHPKTGLTPDYANFDGSPIDPWKRGNDNFQYDAWRVGMNIGLDYEWFAFDNWAIEQNNRLLKFFEKKGIKTHGTMFTLDGKTLRDTHNPGLVAMNAAACLASTNKSLKAFLEEFWNTDIPKEEGRYFDGLLYMLGLLAASGNFRIYDPTGKIIPKCPKK
jgi:oligosaccharide reducing-end xylanase